MIGMDAMEQKIKVLIVDDAVMVRKILSRELSKNQSLEVVGTAADAFIAREMIGALKPDVILLDIEMPQMGGLTFLEQLMENYPMPVIIVSSLVREGGAIALRALELGAVEVIAKPGPAYSVKEMCEQLIEKIKAVTQIKHTGNFLNGAVVPVAVPSGKNLRENRKVIAIGASTGGTEAIASILASLPAEMPPILIVQHMPACFIEVFAERMRNLCSLEVKVAENHELLCAGKVLLAPGNKHIVLQKNKKGYEVAVKDGPMVLHQRPSIEVLFRSVAMYFGADAIGVVLTGMGKDGAQGLLDMKEAGAITIAQDEASCMVYGTAREAVEIGAVSQVVSLERIPQVIIDNL